MQRADELVTDMMDRILVDLPFEGGDRVCLLVNDLGSTTLMKLDDEIEKLYDLPASSLAFTKG